MMLVIIVIEEVIGWVSVDNLIEEEENMIEEIDILDLIDMIDKEEVLL